MSFSLKVANSSDKILSISQNKLQLLIEKVEQQKIELAKWECAKNDILQYARTTFIPMYGDLHTVLFSQFDVLYNSLSNTQFGKVDLIQLDQKIQSLIQLLEQSKNLSVQQLNRLEKAAQFYKQYEEAKINKKSKNKVFNNTNEHLNELEMSQKEDEFDVYDEWDNAQYQKIREQAKFKKQQEKREEASILVEQSIKKVYLKIASSIHPDREQDEAKKIEKTVLFQRANEAYEQQDLFFLLKMQIQVEQDVAPTKKDLSDETIKFYKQALNAQSQKLQSQIDDIIHALVWSEKAKITVKKAKGRLNIADLYKQIDADTSVIKQQLKAEKERLKYMSKESGLAMLLEHGVL